MSCGRCGTSFGFISPRPKKCPHCPIKYCKKCINAHLQNERKKQEFQRRREEERRKATQARLEREAKEREKQIAEKERRAKEAKEAAAKPSELVSRVDESIPKQPMRHRGSATVGSTSMGIAPPSDPTEIFEILQKLGEGSFGCVFKALDKRDGRIIALKVLEDQDLAMQKEIDILRQLEHQNIVSYKGSFIKGDTIWIAMELCGVGSLADLMAICDQSLTEAQIAVVMKHCLRGLVYLHSTKKIHRDLKAGNILLTTQGDAKLADFGVSVEMKSTIARQRTVIGTPFWMAPEVLTSQGHDTKADIWSLGICAIELAHQVPPHSNIHPMTAIFMIPNKPPPTLPAEEDWSDNFRDFLRVCLQKDPNARPTAVQLLQSHPFILNAGDENVLEQLSEQCLPMIEMFRHQEALEAEMGEGDEDDELVDNGTVLLSDTCVLNPVTDTTQIDTRWGQATDFEAEKRRRALQATGNNNNDTRQYGWNTIDNQDSDDGTVVISGIGGGTTQFTDGGTTQFTDDTGTIRFNDNDTTRLSVQNGTMVMSPSGGGTVLIGSSQMNENPLFDALADGDDEPDFGSTTDLTAGGWQPQSAQPAHTHLSNNPEENNNRQADDVKRPRAATNAQNIADIANTPFYRLEGRRTGTTRMTTTIHAKLPVSPTSTEFELRSSLVALDTAYEKELQALQRYYQERKQQIKKWIKQAK